MVTAMPTPKSKMQYAKATGTPLKGQSPQLPLRPAQKTEVPNQLPARATEEVRSTEDAKSMACIMEALTPPVGAKEEAWMPMPENEKDEQKEAAVEPPASPVVPPAPEPTKYRVTQPESFGGIAIYGADPKMQQAYRHFLRDGIKMGEFVPVSIPGGIGKLMSPLSMRIANDLLSAVAEMAEKNGIKRVVCIVRREDVEIPIVKHLLHVPDGKDFVVHVMDLARAFVKKAIKLDVEMYLSEIQANGEVEFFRLD